ncbi:uncharacterized protein [Nothobranchius furzeri]
MRVNILLFFVLGSHVIADLPHEAVKETKSITLSCGRPGGDIVTWSMERNGIKEYILTNDGSTTIKHIKDPNKMYDAQHDKSLYIMNVDVSDSGRYFCNDESAVELTVIPSGTRTQTVEEGKDTTIKCLNASEGYKPSWSREIAGKPERIRSAVPPGGEKLKITQVQLSDFGLYFCNGKPAVYLKVTKNNKHRGGILEKGIARATLAGNRMTTSMITEMTTKTVTQISGTASTSETTTNTRTDVLDTTTRQDKYLSISVKVKVGILILLTIIIIIYFAWRGRSDRRDKRCDVSDDVN